MYANTMDEFDAPFKKWFVIGTAQRSTLFSTTSQHSGVGPSQLTCSNKSSLFPNNENIDMRMSEQSPMDTRAAHIAYQFRILQA